MSATPVSKNRATAKQHSLAQNVNMSAATLDMRALDDKSSHRISTVDTIDKAMINRGWEPAAVYVFGDKSNLKVSFLERGSMFSSYINKKYLRFV